MENLNTHMGNSRVRGMLTFVLIMLVIALGTYSYAKIKETQTSPTGPATISVNGMGEVVARPDIATFSFSVVTEGDDASSAQEDSAKAINAILAYLKSQNIEDKDIKTLYYNLNPRYEYMESICNTRGLCPQGERVLRGYEVNQTIQIKVRDIENAGSLISGVGTQGATNVSSLAFTIDDEEKILAEAREKAIIDARAQAEELAHQLGVRLVRIVSFYENGGGYPMYNKMEMGIGGASDSAVPVSPEVPSGENSFTSNVNITYEIR